MPVVAKNDKFANLTPIIFRMRSLTADDDSPIVSPIIALVINAFSCKIPFFKAWMLGLAIAAPVGPIRILCIRYSLTAGLKYGLAVGLGAALADSLYGVLVGGGLSAISEFLLDKQLYIKLIGGCLLVYLAMKEIKSKQILSLEDSTIPDKTCFTLIFTTLLLTLTNPLTIMSFIGVFSTSFGGDFTAHEVTKIIIGVFLGSMSWWLLLSKISNFSKRFVSFKILKIIKYISATVLSLFGIFALASIVPYV